MPLVNQEKLAECIAETIAAHKPKELAILYLDMAANTFGFAGEPSPELRAVLEKIREAIMIGKTCEFRVLEDE